MTVIDKMDSHLKEIKSKKSCNRISLSESTTKNALKSI